MRFHFYLAILSMMVPAPVVHAQGQKDSVKGLKSGVFLNAVYLEKLIATKSPYVASRNVHLTLAELGEHGDHERILGVSTFHEGVGTFVFHDDQLIENFHGANIQVAHPDRFTFRGRVGPPTEFVRLEGPVERLMCSTLLSGGYHDDSERSYTFTSDCHAQFPSEAFAFEVGLDHLFMPFDYIRRKDNGELIAFRNEGGRLRAYFSRPIKL